MYFVVSGEGEWLQPECLFLCKSVLILHLYCTKLHELYLGYAVALSSLVLGLPLQSKAPLKHYFLTEATTDSDCTPYALTRRRCRYCPELLVQPNGQTREELA